LFWPRSLKREERYRSFKALLMIRLCVGFSRNQPRSHTHWMWISPKICWAWEICFEPSDIGTFSTPKMMTLACSKFTHALSQSVHTQHTPRKKWSTARQDQKRVAQTQSKKNQKKITTLVRTV
jgi:hypothetical protein